MSFWRDRMPTMPNPGELGGLPDPPPEAQGTAGMWANMLGIGPLLQTIQDPNFQAQIQSLLRMVVETHQRTERLETLVMELINEQRSVTGARAAAELSFGNGAVGTGGHTSASGAPDDGSGSDPRADGGSGRAYRAPGGRADSARPDGETVVG